MTRSKRPWLADFEIEPATAKQLIADQFPALRPVSLQPFAEGWDNNAFLVNDAFVFRFPRRRIAVPLLVSEMRLLPLLAGRLPLAVPNPEWQGVASEAFPYPFAGYRQLPGRSACAVNPTPAHRAALAGPLGAFLAVLHRQADIAPREELPGDTFQRAEPVVMAEKIRQRFDPDAVGFTARQSDAYQRLLSIGETYRPKADSLVHGDLYVRHLLLNGDGALTGVIDWGDMHLGDAAVDLAIAWSFLPRQAHAPFRAAYGPIDTDTWRVARLRALYSGTGLWLYGHDRGDANLVRESRAIFNQVLLDQA